MATEEQEGLDEQQQEDAPNAGEEQPVAGEDPRYDYGGEYHGMDDAMPDSAVYDGGDGSYDPGAAPAAESGDAEAGAGEPAHQDEAPAYDEPPPPQEQYFGDMPHEDTQPAPYEQLSVEVPVQDNGAAGGQHENGASPGPKTGIPKAPPGKSPSRKHTSRNISPSRIPKVKIAEKKKNYWNPVSWKPEDASFALHKSPNASPGRMRPSANVSLPSKEESEKRRSWKEEQARRQQVLAMRLMEAEKRSKAEAEAKLEERRRKVRERIEQEKGAILKRDANSHAPSRAASHASSPARRRNGELPPINGGSGELERGRAQHRSASRRRGASPKPLYMRLQEEFEAKQAQEEVQLHKQLEEITKNRKVRVHQLIAGEVVIKPLPGEGLESVKARDSSPRWNVAYRAQPTSPSRGRSTSPRRSGAGAAADEAWEEPGSPGARSAHGDGGPALYGQGGRFPPGADAVPSGRGQLVGRNGNGRRFSGNSRRPVMVDRVSSPFVVDPASNMVLNAPPQDHFWKGGRGGGANGNGKRTSGGSMHDTGALTQDPPPPPGSRLAQRKGVDKQARGEERHSPNPPPAPLQQEASELPPLDMVAEDEDEGLTTQVMEQRAAEEAAGAEAAEAVEAEAAGADEAEAEEAAAAEEGGEDGVAGGDENPAAGDAEAGGAAEEEAQQ